jgi:virginiamycin B lyase
MKPMLEQLRPSLSAVAYRVAYAVLTLVVAICLVLLASGRAQAAPVVDGTFDLSGDAQRIAQGPDGNMWATLGGGNEIARITPQGAVTEFDVPLFVNPIGIGSGPDGKLWVTFSTKVGRFDPADPAGTAEAFDADIAGGQQIVTGPDGNLWTVAADKLLRITPAAAPVVQAFPILTAGVDIAASADRLWIADSNGGEVVSATTNGEPTRYATGGTPRGIAVGPGGQIGYTNPAPPASVGRVIAGGSPLPTPAKPATDPFGMTVGADGAYWFAQAFGDNLGRLTTDGVYSEFGDFGPDANPRYIAAGPGNTLWVTLQELGGVGGKKVIRVSGLEPPVNPQPISAKRPVVAKLRLSAKRFRIGKARTPLAAQKRRRGKAAPVGTTIRFSLNEAADVRVSFQRKTAGRRNGERCVKPKPRLRANKRCTRWVKVRGALTRKGLNAGAQQIAFSGRIGRKALNPDAYRLTIVASTTRRSSKAVRENFRILPPRR